MWPYSKVTSDFHKWDVLHCKTLSMQIILNNFFFFFFFKHQVKRDLCTYCLFKLEPKSVQIEIQEIPFKNKKYFFTARMMEDWNRLLRQVGYWFSIPGDIQNLTQTKPWTTYSSWPCFEGSDNLQMVLSNSNHSVIPQMSMIISLLTVVSMSY